MTKKEKIAFDALRGLLLPPPPKPNEIREKVPLSDVQKEARKSPFEKRFPLASKAARKVPYLGGLLLAYDASKRLGILGDDETQEAVLPPQLPITSKPATEPVTSRFSEVLAPSQTSTAKEVLNAAMLRAGLSLFRGGDVRDAVKAAASVSDSLKTYRTGAEALAAGQENLGPTADIVVSQNTDGTYKYSGRTDAALTALNSLIGNNTEAKPKTKITKEQRDALAEVVRQQQPDATEEDIKDTLEAQGYIYP